MDFVKIRKRINDLFDKYKYVCLVLLVGIVLMIIPGRKLQSEQIVKEENIVATE